MLLGGFQMNAVPAAAPTGAQNERVNEIVQLLERALSLVDECQLPADVGARLAEVIQSVRDGQTSSSS